MASSTGNKQITDNTSVAGQEGANAYGQAYRALQSNTAAQKSALQAIQGQVNSGYGFDAATAAGKRDIRAQNAQTLAAQGGRAGAQGAGGYGAMQQGGLMGGIASAKFGADQTVDKAKMALAGAQALSATGEAYGNAGQAEYGMYQESPYTQQASQERMGKWSADIADNLEKNSGVFNDDENAYEAKWSTMMSEAKTPEEVEWLKEEKKKADEQIYGWTASISQDRW